jgi:hypothetical protein
VAPTTVFYLSFLFAVSGGGDLEFFFGVSHQRERGIQTRTIRSNVFGIPFIVEEEIKIKTQALHIVQDL